MDHVRNKVIREQLGQEEIVEKVCRKREAWKTRVEEKGVHCSDGVMSGIARKKTKRKAK